MTKPALQRIFKDTLHKDEPTAKEKPQYPKHMKLTQRTTN